MNYFTDLLFLIPGAIIAYTIHEYTKALASSCQGDLMPKNTKRLTLNPISHFEPIGFLCILFFGFGWGKPVVTSPMYYKDRKKGNLVTYITPSMINLLLGIVFAILFNLMDLYVLKALAINGTSAGIIPYVMRCIYYVAVLNINMALFNIIPVYPLDGAKILNSFISVNTQVKISSYQRIFQILLIFLLFSGIIGFLLNPLCNVFLNVGRW